MDEHEAEILPEEEFRETFTLSPKEIRQAKGKMIFNSIVFPDHKIRKRAYIYELLTSQTHYSIKRISRMAQCGISKIYKVKEMIALNYPVSSCYEEPHYGRPTRMNEDIKQQLVLQASGTKISFYNT